MTSKRLKKVAAAVLALCLVMSMLTACTSGLKGTYKSVDGVAEQSFTFMDDNKVKVSAFNINVEGEYVIEDNTITITYGLLGISYDWEKSFVKKGNSIFIDGTEFVKEK